MHDNVLRLRWRIPSFSFFPLFVFTCLEREKIARRPQLIRSYLRGNISFYLPLPFLDFYRSKQLFSPPPPPPQHPRCIPFTPSSTHSLFLVRILFINRDRFVSLFRRRRRRRRRGRMLARSRNKVVGGISKAGSDRFVYEIQDEVPSPRLWFVRGHKIIDADRCFCAPMTRCPRKIKAVPWPAN